MSRTAMPTRARAATLSPEEVTKRAIALTLAETGRQARSLNGAAHQDEIPEERSGTAREAPSTGMRDGTAPPAVQSPVAASVGAQPAAPLPPAGISDAAGPASEASADDLAHLPRLIQGGAPVDRWVKSSRGLTRWRPVVDRVEVDELPHDCRTLTIFGRQQEFDAELSAHLAWLLMPEDWRIALSGQLAEASR